MQKQCLMGTHNGTNNVSDIFLDVQTLYFPRLQQNGLMTCQLDREIVWIAYSGRPWVQPSFEDFLETTGRDAQQALKRRCGRNLPKIEGKSQETHVFYPCLQTIADTLQLALTEFAWEARFLPVFANDWWHVAISIYWIRRRSTSCLRVCKRLLTRFWGRVVFAASHLRL